jgi:hypothetical protein
MDKNVIRDGYFCTLVYWLGLAYKGTHDDLIQVWYQFTDHYR